MDDAHATPGSNKPLLTAIAVVLAVYLISALSGAPQYGAKLIAEEEGHNKQAAEAHPGQHAEQPPHQPQQAEHPAEQGTKHAAEAGGAPHPAFYMVLPFVLLLGAIAVLPLVPATTHWWDNNLNRFIVAASLGAITLLYYLLLHNGSIAGHWPVHHVVSRANGGYMLALTVLANAILNEYIPFIMLLFSLYTISGGIRIQGDLRAHPLTNSAIIAIGGVLASFVGTTGAAMLLIRLLLETNRERKHVKHTVIFFIFVVCNCGGCLLPIGDPPLFLGYLRGVPFLWTFALWKQWLLVNGALIAIYYLWDRFWYYPHERPADVARDETRVHPLKVYGIWPNAFLLLGVILSVALLDPHIPLPGADWAGWKYIGYVIPNVASHWAGWQPWLYLREIVQVALVALSLIFGSHAVRRANNFNYHAIVEVAALFFGIFICMQPPLEILAVRGPNLGLSTPMQFFWSTGSLSSVLDNAPTYVVFFETAKTLGGNNLVPPVTGVAANLLVAVSLGAVFMGSMTYIGNGPNFMVKAIAEKSGIRMPSFFGYMLYSCCILLPLFILTTCMTWIVLPALSG
jgi:Na+/H+ antiporter NhaD/arsenite permease-like protein